MIKNRAEIFKSTTDYIETAKQANTNDDSQFNIYKVDEMKLHSNYQRAWFESCILRN